MGGKASKEYRQKYYQENKEILKEKQKIYRENNKETIHERQKKWRKDNPDKILAEKYYGDYYKNNYKEKRIQRVKKYKDEWMKIIIGKGMNFCSKCGYNKCFGALDFHHLDASNKLFNIGILLARRPSENLIKELDKCICLCSNCHRELHFGEKK